jgi:SAM-dependent methyltransferase
MTGTSVRARVDERVGSGIRRLPRPPFRLRDLVAAPIHDFPIRDFILHQFSPLLPNLRVLEVGPGSGFTAYGLGPIVERLTLVDYAEVTTNDLRRKLDRRGDVRCVTADVSQPGLLERVGEQCGFIFALDVFEYMSNPECCLRNFAEVLNAGGVLFLTFPNHGPETGDGVTYFHRLSDLDELLSRAGFSRWQISSVALKRYARLVYIAMHEWPLSLYRRFRRRSAAGRPQTYESTWAFANRERLGRAASVLNLYWLLLSIVLRCGGDPFYCAPAPAEPLGRQLVVCAWK